MSIFLQCWSIMLFREFYLLLTLFLYFRAPEKFISYRDSLLTRLLKDSLGGNGMSKCNEHLFLYDLVG